MTHALDLLRFGVAVAALLLYVALKPTPKK
jgi:hypothetical protein